MFQYFLWDNFLDNIKIMTTVKTYSISVDIISGNFNLQLLTDQVKNVFSSLQYINTPDSDTITLMFNDILSAENITTLDGIISLHDSQTQISYNIKPKSLIFCWSLTDRVNTSKQLTQFKGNVWRSGLTLTFTGTDNVVPIKIYLSFVQQTNSMITCYRIYDSTNNLIVYEDSITNSGENLEVITTNNKPLLNLSSGPSLWEVHGKSDSNVNKWQLTSFAIYS